jgi:hypothetical protein
MGRKNTQEGGMMRKMQKILSCHGEGWIVVIVATISKPNTHLSNQTEITMDETAFKDCH